MIIVQHDRDDKGWIVTRSGQFASGTVRIHKELYPALVQARDENPDEEIFVDDRTHHKWPNGMVHISGEQDLMPVEWK